MFSLMLINYKNFYAEKNVSVQTSADNLEDLLVNWLQELLYTFEVKLLVTSDFHVKIDDRKSLKGYAGCERYNEKKYGYPMEIKAVTYHNLVIKKNNNLYSVEIIFDV